MQWGLHSCAVLLGEVFPHCMTAALNSLLGCHDELVHKSFGLLSHFFVVEIDAGIDNCMELAEHVGDSVAYERLADTARASAPCCSVYVVASKSECRAEYGDLKCPLVAPQCLRQELHELARDTVLGRIEQRLVNIRVQIGIRRLRHGGREVWTLTVQHECSVLTCNTPDRRLRGFTPFNEKRNESFLHDAMVNVLTNFMPVRPHAFTPCCRDFRLGFLVTVGINIGHGIRFTAALALLRSRLGRCIPLAFPALWS